MINPAISGLISEIVGEENCSWSKTVLYTYGSDASIHHRAPDLVVRVNSAQQVSAVLKLAIKYHLPVVPRGAGTSLCGHTIPIKGGIVLDLQPMNRLLEVRVGDLVCVVEPGLVYQELNKRLSQYGFFFPPDPGSGEVCTLGGMVVTNASGQRAVKYGATRDYTLGLEVVLPSGEIVDLGTETLKDTSGYQLARLLVGSEGTLGVITRVTLRILPLPQKKASLIASFDKIEKAALCVSKTLQSSLIPARLELMDSICIKAINKVCKLNLPESEAMLLVELDGHPKEVSDNLEKIKKIFQEVGVLELTATAEERESEKLWLARKSLIPALSRYQEGAVCVSLADDMAVPMTKIPNLVRAIHKIANKYNLLIPTYGHAGDGNLHTKVLLEPTVENSWQRAKEAVKEIYESVFSLSGTTSGEHGCGITKAPLMQREREKTLFIMKEVKKVFDPKGVMNPGKMMDWEGDFVTHLRYKLSLLEEKNHLSLLKQEMITCSYCGYCKGVCPVYKELGWETDAARGKVMLSYGILNKELSLNQELAERFYQCTQCKDCYRRCPAKIRVPEIVLLARADAVEAGFGLKAHQILAERIEKTGNIFGDLELTPPSVEGERLVFIGCQYLARPNKTKMYLKILTRLGIKVKVQSEICCGFPLKILGFKEILSHHQKRFLAEYNGDEIIAFCPSCSVFLKENYGFKVKHILEVILEKIPQCQLKKKVTYHDPCDLARGIGIISQPREIIRKLGLELCEMENHSESSKCCGGGGGLLGAYPDLANRIAETRIKEALSTKAEFLITACPTCEQVLKKAAQNFNLSVVDLRELLWQAVK